MKNYMKSHSALFSLTAANVVNNGVTFIVLLWLSKSFNPSEFGLFTLCVSIVTTASVVLDFGAGLSMVKWYNAKESTIDKGSVVPAAVFIRAMASVCLIIVAYPLSNLIKDNLLGGVDLSLAMIALFGALAMSWWNFLRSLTQAKQDYRSYTVLVILFALLRFVSVCIVLLLGVDWAFFFIIAMYLLPPTIICVAYMLYNKSGRPRSIYFNQQVRSIAAQLLVYGKWPFASMILFPLVTTIPLWIMGNNDDLASAGAYGIGIYFASAIAPIREAIRIYMLPKIVGFDSLLKAREHLNIVKSRFIYVVPIIIIIASLAIFAQYIINGDKYENAYLVILLMIATQIITMFTNLIGAILHYLGRPQIDTYTNGLRLLLSVFLSLSLIPNYGVIGAVIASSSSILIGEYFIYRYVQKQLYKVDLSTNMDI